MATINLVPYFESDGFKKVCPMRYESVFSVISPIFTLLFPCPYLLLDLTPSLGQFDQHLRRLSRVTFAMMIFEENAF